MALLTVWWSLGLLPSIHFFPLSCCTSWYDLSSRGWIHSGYGTAGISKTGTSAWRVTSLETLPNNTPFTSPFPVLPMTIREKSPSFAVVSISLGVIYCNAGAGLVAVTGIGDILTPRVLVSLVLLALFAMAPVVYRKVKRSRGSATLP